MNLLVYADLQATETGARCRSDPTVPLRRRQVELFFDEIAEIYKNRRCVGLADLGDTTDDRSFVHTATLSNLFSRLHCILDGSQYSFKLTGNHEQHVRDGHLDTSPAYFTLFKYVSGADNNGGLIVDLHEFKLTVALASYRSDPRESTIFLEDALRAVKPGYRSVLLGHLDARGATYPSGQAVDTGVPMSALRGFDVALLGHIHKPQQISPHTWYVGAPFQQDFGMVNTPGQVAILNLENLQVEFIPLSRSPGYHRVDLAGLDQVKDPGEDRYQVLVTTEEEASAARNHPLSRLVELEIQIPAAPTSSDLQSVKDGQVDWLSVWLSTHPPGNEMAAELDAVLAVGRQLAGDT